MQGLWARLACLNSVLSCTFRFSLAEAPKKRGLRGDIADEGTHGPWFVVFGFIAFIS
jgi:hypothetical protein